jgi:hypothetical protein
VEIMQETDDVILSAYKSVADKGIKKVTMESETDTVTAYKVGLVTRIDVKIKDKKEE